MTTYSWTGKASTDFANAANWLDAATGAPGGVPGAADTVVLAGTGEITGTGTVNALSLTAGTEGHSYYVLDGAFSSDTVSALGVLQVMGGSGLLADSIDIGSAATYGELDIAATTVGALDGKLGVVVSDGQSTGIPATLNVGVQNGQSVNSGTLLIGQGSVVAGNGAGQAGRINVAGSLQGGTASSLVIGQAGGTGTLTETYAPFSGPARISVGRLVLGESGTGTAVLTGGDLMLGGGKGPALVLGTQDGVASAAGTGSLQGTFFTGTITGLSVIGDTGQGTIALYNAELTTTGGMIIGNAASAGGSVSFGQVAWMDTGNVIVGNHGAGTLAIEGSGPGQSPGNVSTIHGDVQIGVRGGSGAVSVTGATLTVTGNTVLGSSAHDTISLDYGVWNSAGHGVRLLGGSPAAPFTANDLVTLSADSSLIAGFLSVGTGDVVQAAQDGTLSLGMSAAGTAASIAGTISLGLGSTLTALGNVRIDDPNGNNAQQSGLDLFGGTAKLTASGDFALTLASGGRAMVEDAAAQLSAQGGILACAGGGLLIEGGTVSAMSSGNALDIASGGGVYVQSGMLSTKGMLTINDTDIRSGQFNQGGMLYVSAGATLSSVAAASGGVAVSINGGTATIGQAAWTVDGRFEVGTTRQGGRLEVQGAQIDITGALLVGGPGYYAHVSTSDTDTLVSGGTLAAGQTGIAASEIIVNGAGAYVSSGALDVGTAASHGSMSIVHGAMVSLAGAATIDGVLHLGNGNLASGETVTVSANSLIEGYGTLSGNIVDQGAIRASGGTLYCMGGISGSGVLGVSHATLQLGGVETAGVVFGAAGTLVTPSIGELAGTLSGWQSGDAILFTGQDIASDSYAHGTLSLYDSTHKLLGTETFRGPVSAANFVLSSLAGTGTMLSYHT